jgi:copper chaperone CopZ
MQRQFTVLLLLSSLLAGCQKDSQTVEVAPDQSARPEQVPAENPPPAAPESVATLYVMGMSCPQCANNIDKQLRKVIGVKSVTIDLGSGRVQASLEPKMTPTRDQLARAIEQSGFTLQRIEMPKP